MPPWRFSGPVRAQIVLGGQKYTNPCFFVTSALNSASAAMGNFERSPPPCLLEKLTDGLLVVIQVNLGMTWINIDLNRGSVKIT